MGDRVFTCRAATGTYAEKALVDETRAGFLGDLSFEQGAGIGVPYFTAYRALVLRSDIFSFCISISFYVICSVNIAIKLVLLFLICQICCSNVYEFIIVIKQSSRFIR